MSETPKVYEYVDKTMQSDSISFRSEGN